MATKADNQYLSVTSILGAMDKPALVPWAAYRVTDEFVKDPDYWVGEIKRNPREARKRLADSRFRPEGGGELSATELGSQLHKAAETWAITGVRPKVVHPEVVPLLDNVGDLFDLYQPEWVASEIIVLHRGYGYAGQCDGIWKINGRNMLIDFKTSAKTHNGDGSERTPYPEVSLQTAAYRHGELVIPWQEHTRERKRSGRWYTIPDEAVARAVPMPADIDGTLAVYVTPGFAHPHELLSGDEEWHTFLHLLEVSRWMNGRGKNSVGPVMAPPGRGDVRMAQGQVA
jgi:hypothetical protein